MKKALIILPLTLLFISCKKHKTLPEPETTSNPTIFFQGISTVVGASFLKQEIYATNEDGTVAEQLTHFSSNGALDVFTGEPALTPDGKKIIFVSHKEISGGEIFSMNTDGTGVTKIIPNFNNNNLTQGPVVFQNGQKILYFQELGTGMNRHGEIFTADINGSNNVSLTSNFPADGNCFDPCINPAGTTIVYSNLIAGNSFQLYSMNVSGTNKQLLTTTGPAIKKHPQFSPDGKKIVFDSGAGYGGSAGIYIMNADGSDVTLINGNYNIWGPTFSKDGKSIYYTWEGKLYKMNIDGSNNVQIKVPGVGKVQGYNICVK